MEIYVKISIQMLHSRAQLHLFNLNHTISAMCKDCCCKEHINKVQY